MNANLKSLSEMTRDEITSRGTATPATRREATISERRARLERAIATAEMRGEAKAAAYYRNQLAWCPTLARCA